MNLVYGFSCSIEIRTAAEAGLTKRKHMYFQVALISYTPLTFLFVDKIRTEYTINGKGFCSGRLVFGWAMALLSACG